MHVLKAEGDAWVCFPAALRNILGMVSDTRYVFLGSFQQREGMNGTLEKVTFLPSQGLLAKDVFWSRPPRVSALRPIDNTCSLLVCRGKK